VVAAAVAGHTPGPAHAVHGLRGADLGQRLRDLQLDALGYHALAFPDPLRIDNEGPIGHDYRLTAIEDWLAGGDAVDAAAEGGAAHREWLSARLQHDGDRDNDLLN
jgi:hypothetical protein